MFLALKVDVDTLRGTREGVPALLRLFDRHQVRATFLFSLGPDHTGRALRRIFRRGFLNKVGRTSVLSHYGLKTLLYGVLLPGPHIGRQTSAILRAAASAGHEIGIHCHDHVLWQDNVAQQDQAWTRQEMAKACVVYEEIFGHPARVHGAAGWQMNGHALALEEAFGFTHASDTRGTHPFLPIMDGIRSSCIQLPTTLPTLDEWIGRQGITPDTVQETILSASRTPLPHGHVYTLHAELEGMKLLPVMEALLQGWQQAGYSLGTLADLKERLTIETLPRHAVTWGQVEGRSGMLAVQGTVAADAATTINPYDAR
ncbi:MAG: 4-deoxy-4-formamido-L-arabinose-phosphoundecaprenol deformylase [Magnetococcales bacterium]|nr:4-deoxy-4-formamido-L-arabinose-phosphoundecaprenol deformylase [Magnetococcales bacterium]